MNTFVREFKEFAMRGNVIDLAVGVIIGAAFGRITTSLVDDVIMPLIGLMVGGNDFSDLVLVLRDNPEGMEDVVLAYGNLIEVVLNFLLIALALFIAIKFLNRLQRSPEQKKAAEKTNKPVPKEEVVLLTEIRDALRKSS